LLGERIAQRYRVVNHDARDAAAHTSLGEIAFGEGNSAYVALDNTYLRADLKITTGLIEPHFMAGYSGGRKLVCPGIASAETILQFHAPPMIAHPGARAGNLQDNPIHAMSRAVAQKAGMDFLCNVTLSEERQITGVFSGALDEAHAAGVAHVDRQTKVACHEADIVITTGAGYPLDTTLYQAIKGMRCALPAVREGGTIIVTAGMQQGVGGHEFAAMCATLSTPEEFLARIFSSEVIIDQWQLQEMAQVLQKCEVMVVTDGLQPETLRQCLLTPMPSLPDALQVALKKHGTGACLTVIPEGPYVTPVPFS
jgi:nickel-dependent lactate racemase